MDWMDGIKLPGVKDLATFSRKEMKKLLKFTSSNIKERIVLDVLRREADYEKEK